MTGSTVWPAMTCVGVAFQREKGPTPDGCSRPSHLADDPDCERDPMKVSDPLRRGLRTALQLTITLLSTGALVTVLNGLLHAREEYSAVAAVLLPFVTTALNSLDARGKRLSRGVPGVRKTLLPTALSIRAPRG